MLGWGSIERTNNFREFNSTLYGILNMIFAPRKHCDDTIANEFQNTTVVTLYHRTEQREQCIDESE